MTLTQVSEIFAAGQKLAVTCPDGVERMVWGANWSTGDVYVSEWAGDVFMDCSSGEVRVVFE